MFSMKRIFLLFPSILLLLFIPASTHAQDSSGETKNVVLAKDEVINKDYLATGDTITLSGIVNGDAYLFAGSVIVEGKVNGDLITAGGQITIRGDVSGDVRAFGGQISISGNVGRNLTFAGGNIDITDAAKVKGSVVGAGGNVSMFAPIGKGAKFGVGNLTLGSKVGGDIEAGVGQLTLTSEADVVGDLTYWSNQEANVHEGAKIVGDVSRKAPPEGFGLSPAKVLGVAAGINIFFQLIALVSSLIVGLLLLRFLPNSTKLAIGVLEKRPWATLGIGLLSLIVTPIVIVLLLIAIITIPIALILLAGYLIALYLTRIYISYFIGKKIFSQFTNKEYNYWSLFVGLIIFAVISLIPIIGGIFVFLSVLFGLGTIFFKLKEEYLASREKGIL